MGLFRVSFQVVSALRSIGSSKVRVYGQLFLLRNKVSVWRRRAIIGFAPSCGDRVLCCGLGRAIIYVLCNVIALSVYDLLCKNHTIQRLIGKL